LFNEGSLVKTVGPGKMPIQLDAAVSSVALVGTLVGQLFFGWLGDKLGRKAVYGIVLAIMIFAAFAQAFSFGTSSSAVIGSLCFWRLILGFGVGGDYPLSATIMSEYSSKMSRGAYIGSVFAMQGMGILAAAAVTAIVAACFDAAYPSKPYPWNVGPYQKDVFFSATKWSYGTNSVYTTSTYGKWSTTKLVGSSYVGSGTLCCDSIDSAPATTPMGWASACYKIPCESDRKFYYAQILDSCRPEMDFVWRAVLAIGALPALLTLYARSQIAETPRYTAFVSKESDRALEEFKTTESNLEGAKAEVIYTTAAKEEAVVVIQLNVAKTSMPFSTFISKYGLQVLGCAMSWFLLDVAFYSQNLFQSNIFQQVGFLPPAKYMYAIEEVGALAKAQALIALGSTIPGYWFTVFFVDYLGRWKIQLMGFTIMTALMAALAGTFVDLLTPNNSDNTSWSPDQPVKRNGWIAMYAFCFFFANFGPNSTTFIYPAELFPTEWRSTGHGFCAAMGKLGAIIGAFGFLYAAQPGPNETFYSFPCSSDYNDLGVPDRATYSGSSAYKTGIWATKHGPDYACKVVNNCPGGRQTTHGASGTADRSGSLCSVCTPNLLSGCFPFGIGIQGALGILAGTNFLGMLFTFLLPETMGKSLEELNMDADAKTEVDSSIANADVDTTEAKNVEMQEAPIAVASNELTSA